jgi:hypothetical protein
MTSTPKRRGERRKREIDFSLWARKAYWTPLEAALLSFSEDPDDFHSSGPGWASERLEFSTLRHRIDDIERAQNAGQMALGFSPAEFLKWASSTELEVPLELKSAIERATGAQSDWRARYEEANSLAESLARQISEHQLEIEKLKRHEREERRHSLQKIVLGIAIRHYGYKIRGSTEAPRLIEEDLARLSEHHAGDGSPLPKLIVDRDTIRKYLAEAANEL